MENQIQDQMTPIPPHPVALPIPPVFPKKNNFVVILLSILLLVTLSATVYLFLRVQSLTKQLVQLQIQPTPTPLSTEIPSPTPDPTADWETYKNNYWKISFKYPNTMFRPCLNYTTEKEGVLFWGPKFTCPDGHDVVYKIGLVGYDPDKYVQPKKPSSTEKLIIDGKEVQKNTYVYDESDGPTSSSLEQSIKVVFSLSNGTIVLQQFGINPDEQKVFEQILSTFKFTN